MRNNAQLEKLWKEDQEKRKKARIDLGNQALAFLEILRSDQQQIASVMEMVKTRKLKTAEDYYNAAMILLHSEVIVEYICVGAVLAQIAQNKGHPKGEWLYKLCMERFDFAIGIKS